MLRQRPRPHKPHVYYGWIVVGISFITLAVAYGARASFSVFLVTIQDVYGWNRGAISGGFALHMLVASIGLPFIGAVVDRYGPRVVLSAGVTILAIGIWQLGGLSKLWHFYVFYGLVMAFGRIMIAMTPHTAIISNWFIKKRGTAMGLAASGISAGSILLVPFMQFSLTRFGWRDGCSLVAILIFLALFPLNALFQRLKPSDLGLFPDGETSDAKGLEIRPESEQEDIPVATWLSTVKSAIRTSRFWLLYLVYLFGAMVTMIDMHQIAFFADVGFDRNTAVTLFAATGLVRSPGVFCGGLLSDKAGREYAFTLGACLQIAGIFALFHITDARFNIKLLLFILCYGFGSGFRTSILPSITADLFPKKRVASVYGLFTTAMFWGTAGGPWLAGYLHDATGSYAMPFRIAIGSVIMACVFLWLMAPRKDRGDSGT